MCSPAIADMMHFQSEPATFDCYCAVRPHPLNWCPDLSQLVTDCMHQNPMDRPKAAEVRASYSQSDQNLTPASVRRRQHDGGNASPAMTDAACRTRSATCFQVAQRLRDIGDSGQIAAMDAKSGGGCCTIS